MRLYFISIFVLLSTSLAAQNEELAIREVLQRFINATIYNQPDEIEAVFHPGADMYLYNDADTLMVLSPNQYADFFRGREGQINNRPGQILTIDVQMDVAYAKLQVDIPSAGRRFYDLILLKKIDGEWKIVSKVTDADFMPMNPPALSAPLSKTEVAGGLNRPWSGAFISEFDLLVAEKDGGLVRLNLRDSSRVNITGLPTDVARAILIDTSGVPKGTYPGSAHGKTLAFNGGWFEVALHPEFAEQPWVYLSYATMQSDGQATTKVIRGRLSDDRLSQVETLFVAEPYSHGLFHFGGGMVFGPDGKLYISVGERNFYEYNNPPLPLSQDVTDKRGKIYRLNADGSIPEDNPDFGPEAQPGLYAIGLRAVQGMTVRPETGHIWFTDHGSTQGDEVNLLRPGANYGWPYRTTGSYRTNDYSPKEPEGLTFEEPAFSWPHTVAPTGLIFYQGDEFPAWQNSLLVGGLSRGSLWRMQVDGQTITSAEELFVDDRIRLRNVLVSPYGKVYLLTDEENGHLLRVRR